MTPRVSVCIPTYNRASMLRQTIKAMLYQTFSDWELIICDDASSDDTEAVVRAFEDERIRYYRNETNLGLYPNWHRCIELASGEYIAIYHDHDVYLPTIVERSVALLDQYPTASFVHTALLFIDDQDTPVGVDIRPFRALTPGRQMIRSLATTWSSPIMAATAMVRRKAYEQVGLYRYQQYGPGCDLDMWFRLCRIGDIAYVAEPQALIRIRSRGQFTAQFRWSDVKGSIRMYQDHLEQAFGRDYFTYLLRKTRFVCERDLRLATFGVRAILLEQPEIVMEGENIIRTEGSLWVAWLFRMVKRSVAMQGLLRRYVLPLHYRRVSRYLETRRREAAEYLEAYPYLRSYLNTVKSGKQGG